MPDLDAGAFERRAILRLYHLERERKRRAPLSFGDFGAHELRVEIERPLYGFGREKAHLRARLRCLLFCTGASVSAQGETPADRRRSG